MTMTCCCSTVGAATERQFSEKRAIEELARYRTKGPGTTARLLMAGIERAGPVHGRLLDIGAGVGALTFELLERGLTEAVGVDLSSAYVAAACQEAARRRLGASARFVHGDFVDVAGQLEVADVVTLDRVICCYPDYEPLLDTSVRHAGVYFATSYPRDVWYVRLHVRWQNLMRQFRGNPFRTYVHSPPAMDRLIRGAGLELVSRRRTWTWSADVYRRA